MHPLLAQGGQGLAEGELGRGRGVASEGQRQHRHIGIGEQVAQHGPGAVVQPAFVDHPHRQPGGLQQRGAALGQRGRAGHVVAQCEQPGVEVPEVMDGRMPGRAEQHQAARGGMGRHRQDGARLAVAQPPGPAQGQQGRTGGTRLERDHR